MKAIVAAQGRYSQAESLHAEINMSHIRFDGGAAGLLFAVGSVCVFLAGVPALRGFLAGAVATGCAISITLRLFHRDRPTLLIPISN